MKWETKTFSNLIDFLYAIGEVKFYSAGKFRKYANIVATFDIETTSFYQNDEGETISNLKDIKDKERPEWHKCATMCAWTFGIDGVSCIGRTWDQFVELMGELKKAFDLSTESRLIVWVQNLSYEFQWIRHLFDWENIFSLAERQPIYALTAQGIEFRCSYLLSGYSLKSMGEMLTDHKIQKRVGDWDYKLMRHTKTPLTAKERGYLLNDGRVVMAYIQEYMNRGDGKITSIPLTKTGAVRRVCRDNCYFPSKSHHNGGTKYRRYRQMILALTIGSPDEYKQAVRAFQGGFTHANPFRVRETIEDVTSMDFTSSYPAVLLSEKFPMSRAMEVKPKTKEDLKKYLDDYLSIFDITFIGLEPKILSENPISLSKCWDLEKEETANGRIVRAKKLSTTLTNIDLSYMKFFYSWKKVVFRNMRVFYQAYLPRDLLLSILEFYEKKTTLKGVKGKEEIYAQYKEYLNSIYGMMVTAITRDDITYKNGEWSHTFPNIKEAITKYNESRNRFLFYYWGLFCTAYARRNLFTGIYECTGKGAVGKDGSLDLTLDDYCYSDTDSVKIRNFDRHQVYFDKYNERVMRKMRAMCKVRDINPEMLSPKTIDGVKKPLGVWDFDGHYKRFKTLGAKRYMVEYDDGEHNITVSGVNKKIAVPYLEDLAKKEKKDIFDIFDDELTIPAEYTGKNIHTYIDEESFGVLKDYTGKVAKFADSSSIHLEETSYSLSMTDLFLDYISGIKTLRR